MEKLSYETKKNIMDELLGERMTEELDMFLAHNGFYDLPASIKHHGAYAGGLFDHSLQVTHELRKLTEKMGLFWQRPESPAVVGMLHDICKVDDYVWKEGGFERNREKRFPGHGEKSILMLSEVMLLTKEEMLCIRYHQGAFTDPGEWEYYSRAVKCCENILHTHTADMIASQILGI